jgi:hypothetical protein
MVNKMTYDGALVMPRNCVRMTEDEMTYVEGGFSNVVKDVIVAVLAAGIAAFVGKAIGYSVLATKITALAAEFGWAINLIAVSFSVNPIATTIIACAVGAVAMIGIYNYGHKKKWW